MHYIITALGCKVNQYEAQAIETLLHAHGFTAAADGEPVDLIVVNTCAVTAEGGRKSRQMIRKLREEHPQALCAVCGCWSQLSPEDAASIGADVVHGSGSNTSCSSYSFNHFYIATSIHLQTDYRVIREIRIENGFLHTILKYRREFPTGKITTDNSRYSS